MKRTPLFSTLLCVLSIALILLFSSLEKSATAHLAPQQQTETPMATDERLGTPGWWPTKQSAALRRPSSSQARPQLSSRSQIARRVCLAEPSRQGLPRRSEELHHLPYAPGRLPRHARTFHGSPHPHRSRKFNLSRLNGLPLCLKFSSHAWAQPLKNVGVGAYPGQRGRGA